MKTKMTQTLLGLAALILIGQMTLAQNGGNYSVDWYTIDGGGGTSTGGVYSVNGTIGQPDAGSSSGGPYSLEGGFWSVMSAVQTPNAPFLHIEPLANGFVSIYWSLTTNRFLLDQSFALGPSATWSPIPLPYQTNASRVSVTVPSPGDSRFYRLRHP
jgi:hypothetical protein